MLKLVSLTALCVVLFCVQTFGASEPPREGRLSRFARLSIEQIDRVHVSKKNGELVAELSLMLNAVALDNPSANNTQFLGVVDLQVSLPLFEGSAVEVSAATPALLDQLARFEATGFDFAQRPEETKISRIRPLEQTDAGVREFFMNISERIFAARDGAILNIVQKTPTREVTLAVIDPAKTQAHTPLVLSKDWHDAEALVRAEFEQKSPSDLELAAIKLYKLTLEAQTSEYEMKRVLGLIEEFTFNLKRFHEAKTLIFLEGASEQADAGSKWNSQNSLDSAAETLTLLGKAREKATVRVCEIILAE